MSIKTKPTTEAYRDNFDAIFKRANEKSMKETVPSGKAYVRITYGETLIFDTEEELVAHITGRQK